MNRSVLPVCVGLWMGVVSLGAQAPPRLIPYAGIVVDGAGQPRIGPVGLTFSVYDVATGGTPLWTETHAAALDARGRYQVVLGATTEGLPADLFVTGAAQWLGVRVESEAEQPRVQLLAVPYAVAAADAATLGGRPPGEFVLVDRMRETVRDEIEAAPRTDEPSIAATAGAIPKFVDSGGTLADSVMAESSGNIGIGKLFPNYALQLHKPGGHSLVQLTNSTTGDQPTDGAYFGVLNGEQTFRLYNLENANIEFFTNNQRRLTIANGGNIGIGTQGPNYLTQLHSAGGHALLQLTNATTGIAAGDGSYFGVLAGNPTFRITNQENFPIEFYTNGVRRMTITTAGNIGIDGGGGGNNTGVGTDALDSLTTGSGNTALGSGALTADTTGYSNTAVGGNALAGNTSGIFNTAVGRTALLSNSTGSSNTAVGQSALSLNTTGSWNTALGDDALLSNSTGSNNTAVGQSSLSLNTTGFANTALGYSALLSNTIGSNNTAVGTGAIDLNTSGGFNTAVGRDALGVNTTGSSNTVIGGNALDDNTTGSNNTALGFNALQVNQTGWRNTAVGYMAGSNATGQDNVYINHEGVAEESGRIRIGTSGSQTAAFIAGIRGVTTGAADAVTVVIDSNGQLGTVSSSRRYKEDIHDMAEASRNVLRLRPVTFRYTQPYADGSKPVDYGLIAEEVAEVFPDLVVYDADGRPETVQYQKLSVLLLNEVERQERQLDDQQRQIDELLNRVQMLERGKP